MNESENNNESEKEVTVETSPETAVVAEVLVEAEPQTEKETPSEPEVAEVVEVAEDAAETVVPVAIEATESVETVTKTTTASAWKFYAGAVAIVLIVLAGVVYVMEQQGRLQTGIFSGVQKMVGGSKAVATVNGTKVSQSDLDVSMAQISAGAAAQGADVASPEVKAQVQTQAIEMLVNTELLKQEAKKSDIAITDEDVNTRLESLKTDVGGEEVLAERMKEFNVDQKTLLRDIRNELTIQALLETVFATKDIAVTEAEVVEVYATAGGVEGGLPPLTEVRPQIEAQIKTTKEQEIVTAYIDELRTSADIEVLI
jgi:foldase protein PrsA